MCKYLLDLKLCEVKGYKDCPPEVVAFMNAYWDAGLSVPKCPTEKAPKGPTKRPWDGFIDNDYNWNADGAQDSNYNPWKGKIGKRSLKGDKSADSSNEWMKKGSDFNYETFMNGGGGKMGEGNSGGSFDWKKFMKF